MVDQAAGSLAADTKLSIVISKANNTIDMLKTTYHWEQTNPEGRGDNRLLCSQIVLINGEEI